MGAWGITTFESDAGLDAVGFVRSSLPENGRLELGSLLAAMKADQWHYPENPEDGCSHTSPMALAEVMVAFLDNDLSALDYTEEWAADDNKFAAITSFTADTESITWLHDYLSKTLEGALKNAAARAKHGTNPWDQWGGWSSEQSWLGWQRHMEMLIERIGAIGSPEAEPAELVQMQEMQAVPVQEMDMLG